MPRTQQPITTAAPLAAGDAVFELRSLRVRRGGATILDEVDLVVPSGELVALVGPNGAGKSTLLGALSGDIRAESGTITFAAADLNTWTSAELARMRAVLTQSVNVGFPFTVSEVVAMGRSPWARTTECRRDSEVIATCLEEAQVGHLATRSFPSLSGGERARAAFARTLAQDTQVLLLDEPTAALDIGHQEDLFAVLRDRVERGSTVIVVVHDLMLASRWADSVVLLEGGRVAAHGHPLEVMTADLLSSVYRHPLDVMAHPTDSSLLVSSRHTARPIQGDRPTKQINRPDRSNEELSP